MMRYLSKLRAPARSRRARAARRRLAVEHLEDRVLLSGVWITQPDIAAMPTARHSPFVAAVDGMLYVAGGNDGVTGASTVLERYDPADDTWTTLASMPQRRYQGGVAVLGSNIYVIGGWDFPTSTLPTRTVQIYDTLTNMWSFGPDMPTRSGSGPTGVIDGKIYKHTAEHGSSSPSRQFHVLDPLANNTWTTLASLPNDHSGGAAGVVNDQLYVAAGTDHGFSVGNHAQVHAYNPVANVWSTLTAGPTPRHGVASGVSGDHLLIAGGSAGGAPLDVFEAYDVASDTWSTLPAMPVTVTAAGGAVIGNTFYVVGGFDGQSVNRLQAFNLGPQNEANVAPTLSELAVSSPINENDFATLTGTITDPGLLDTHNVVVDWDDPNAAADATFALPATNTLTVGQTVNSSTDTAVLTVTAVNTTTGEVSFSAGHQYRDDGIAPGNGSVQDDSTITVTVSDHDGGIDSSVGVTGWTELAPLGTAPAPRNTHTAVYDPATDSMVIFGGRGGPTDMTLFNDAWRLVDANGDGSPQWQAISISSGSPSPSPRWVHQAAYDSDSNTMIVHGGGLGFSSPCSNETWALSNANGTAGPTSSWSLVASGGPAPRFGHSAVYDDANDRLIVFAGSNCFTSPSFGADVWVLSDADGTGSPAWTQLSPTGSINDRASHTAAYDASSNRMIVYGGGNNSGGLGPFNDVYVLTNANGLGGTPQWIEITPVSGPSPAPGGTTSIYDEDDNRLVLFGGVLGNEVWVLQNANGLGGPTQWTEITPVGGSAPSPRSSNSIVFDAANDRLVIFGGNLGGSPAVFGNDVWTLDLDAGVVSPTITVKNTAPTFDAGVDATVPASAVGLFTRSGVAFTDPGTLDVHTVTVDYDGDSIIDQTINVPLGNRTFDLSHTYATSGTFTVSVTVEDDDEGSLTDTFEVTVQPPAIEFSAAAFQDGEAAGNSMVVTLTKTVGSQSNSVVQVNVTGGTAIGGTAATDDYINSSFPLTVTFAPNEFTKTVVVPINQDNIVELNESINFNVVAVSNAAIGPQDTATLTILNDDSAVLNLNSVSGNEDAGPLTFTATLTNPVDVPVTAQADSADGTATTADSDYTALVAEPISIAAGSTSDTVTISLTADNKVELNELFDVLLSNLSAGGRAVTLGTNGIGTILNDDAAPVASVGGPYVINEGDSLHLDAFASTDADDGFAGLTFRWDVDGDGDFDENIFTATPILTWAQLNALDIPINDGPDGPRTITVEASDGTNIDTASTTLTVNNVAPVITTLSAPSMIFENDSAMLTGTFIDPGQFDTHELVVDWDDPNNANDSTFALPATNTLNVNDTFNSTTDSAVLTITAVNTTTGEVSFSLGHQYLDDGLAPGNGTAQDDYTIQVTISDDQGGSTGSQATPAWTELSPSGPLPPKRIQHHAAYNDTNNRMIVFGGTNDAGVAGVPPTLNDVWVLSHADGTTGTPTWTQLAPTGTLPTKRSENGYTYDPVSNRLLVYGGNDHVGFSDGPVNDFWILTNADGTAGTPVWIPVLPTGPNPGARVNHSQHYDAATNRMILFGGNGDFGALPGGLWVLENANGVSGTPNWLQLSPTGAAPSGLTQHSSVYDEATNRLIVFGGFEPAQNNNVRVLENANGLDRTTGLLATPHWTLLSPAADPVHGTPDPVFGHEAVFDPETNEMVVFGGCCNGSAPDFRQDDVWALSHANGLGGSPAWKKITPAGTSPVPRDFHSAVYDNDSNQMIVFAGRGTLTGESLDAQNDVWLLSGITGNGEALNVTVQNVAPDFEAGLDETVPALAAGAFSRTGITFTDPGTLDVHDVTVNFGDGSGDQTTTLATGDRSFDLNHTYATSGTYTVEVTVEDDDAGSLTDTFQITVSKAQVEFTAAAASDSEATGGNLPQLLVLGTLTTAQTIDVTVTAGSATLGSDFTNTATVTIPAGTYDGTLATAVPINLSITDDNVVEATETIELTLANPSSGLVIDDASGDSNTQSTHTYTITDNDTTTLTVSNVSQVETNSGTTNFVFDVTLANGVHGGFDVEVATQDAAATVADNDYEQLANALAFGPFTSLSMANGGVDVLVADFNEDGNQDLIASYNFPGTFPNNPARIAVFLATGPGTFGAPTILTDTPGCWTSPNGSLQVGDFNNDNHLDFSMTHGGSTSCSGDKVTVHLGNGDGTFQPRIEFTTGGSLAKHVVGKFNNDTNEDIVVPTYDSHTTFFHAGNGNGTFAAGSAAISGVNPTGLIAFDFDGDGKLDLATADQWADQVQILFGNGSGGFSVSHTFSLTDGSGMTSGDMDNDGILDLIVTSNAGNVSFLKGQLGGTFASPATAATGLSSLFNEPVAADFDLDGYLDVAIGGVGSSIHILRGNGTGGFAAPISLAAGTNPGGGLKTADVNNDGRPDLISTSSAGVTVLLNASTTASLSFAGTAGEIQQISVTVNGDTKVEINEVFNVLLGAITNLNAGIDVNDITKINGQGTILNDDTATLTITAPTITETDANQTVNFTVTLNAAVEGGFDVAHGLTLGTAEAGDLTVLTTSPISFTGTAGETQTIEVQITGDDVVEDDETFTITLGDVTATTAVQDAAITTGDSAEATIVNDDTAVYTINDMTVNEADGTLTFTVSASNPVDIPVTIDVNYSDVSTTSGDFDHAVDSVTFAALDTADKTVTVAITDDNIVEASETFTASLSTATALGGRSVDTSDTGTGTITNDDTATLTIGDVSVVEGGNLVFTVTLSHDVQGGVNVDFASSDGTATLADNDYAAALGTLSFIGSAGEQQTITVSTTADTKVEADETLLVTLSNIAPQGAGVSAANVSTSGSPATGTIENNDNATLTIGNVSVVEGGSLMFTVTLSADVQGGVNVDFATADGTAMLTDSDYTAASGTLSFSGTAGEQLTITVATTADSKVEADETLTVSLSNIAPQGGGVLAANFSTPGSPATGTILNDDSATLTIGDVSVVEGGNLVFSVTLSNDVQGGVDVDFATADGTAMLTDSDYTAASGTLSFSGTAGEQLTITVATTADSKVEADETLTVSLSNIAPQGGGVSAANFSTPGSPATGTILNDDLATLSINSPTVTEGTGGTTTLTFTVTLDNAVQDGFSVASSDLAGTAGAADYTVTTASPLTFAGTAGETQTISVSIATDAIVEDDETFTITLGDVTGTTAVQDAAITTGAVGTGTILNDDLAILSINSPTVTEGTGGTSTLTFTVSLDNAVQDGFSVAFSDLAGTAGAAEYTVTTTSPLTFAGTAGETQTISVSIATDAIVEDDETFTITLGDVTGTTAVQDAAITTGTVGTGTIENDDTATLSINSPTIIEGTGGTSTLTFTVSLDKAVQDGFSVAFSDLAGTAGAAEYTVTTTSPLTFAGTAGETQTISVSIATDAIVEDDETFTITLGDVTGTTAVQDAAITTGAVGTGTILNDDLATLSINSPTVTEGTGGTTTLTFTVTLDNAVQDGFSVAFSDLAGTAGAADYTVTTASPLTFAGTAGETQTISVSIATDAIVEDDETFTITLGDVTGTTAVQDAAITTGAVGTGTITNDDLATLSINSPTITEGTGGVTTLTFTVTLDNAVQDGFSVAFSDLAGTAGAADYTVTTASPLTFAGTAGETQTISVNIATDAIVEDDETFTITLGEVTGTTAVQDAAITTGAVGTGTILDDDTLVVEFNQATGSDLEASGGNLPELLVSGDVQAGHSVTIDVAVNGGSATGGTDFTTPTTLTVSGGSYTAQAFVIPSLAIIDDNTPEPDETIELGNITGSAVTVGDANGDFITQSSTTYTIINDDSPLALSISDVTEFEGDSGTTAFIFTVSLSTPSPGGVTVDFDTADGSATSTGGEKDYQAAKGKLTFDLGETTKDITISVFGDTDSEADETFFVNLSNPNGAVITDGQGVGTIQNDDAVPIFISITDVSAAEGNSGTTDFIFDVFLSDPVPVGQTVTVDFATADGSATSTGGEKDYQAAKGKVTFASGETSQTITISVFGDTDSETDETFFINLSKPSGAVIADDQGVGTILNDDAPPIFISISDVSAPEGDGGTTDFIFDVFLSSAVPVGQTVTVDFATADDTATSKGNSRDYQGDKGTLTFTAGQTSQTITILVVGDTTPEPNETFFVNLSKANGAIIADAQGVGSILDDDTVFASPLMAADADSDHGTHAASPDHPNSPNSPGTAGTIGVFFHNHHGNLTVDQEARIRDAMAELDRTWERSQGPQFVEVVDESQADVHIHNDVASGCGGQAQGVLGCAEFPLFIDGGQAEVTLIVGWPWYAGSALPVPAEQYDYQTAVTHELAHLLGMDHDHGSYGELNGDGHSAMYPNLSAGHAHRRLSSHDPGAPEGIHIIGANLNSSASGGNLDSGTIEEVALPIVARKTVKANSAPSMRRRWT